MYIIDIVQSENYCSDNRFFCFNSIFCIFTEIK